ncbi:copper chaperone PCu(A)C [Roseateles sp. SL47]|jgi:periplasmic copper chaperone A|uniref:copper chaperone PCu(A)C n=1 Tax=Roseateles sp. SL47 TaxID=2995138 RepID=UPI00226F6E1E|nr:copper chaperone PCu(A)C [Roseateles sp. SL47]WAC72958.1 copper chaperone PCu(A)C [Roseateles sp. SL47]
MKMLPSLSVLRVAVPALLLAVAGPVLAQVKVTAPWVRATVAQQSSTGAFMQLQSPKAVKLVSVSTPVAGIVEVHEMAMDGPVMRMRAVPALELPAGKPVELKPGGYHVMLMDLKGPVKEGDQVPFTLVFEGADQKRETVQIKASVKALGAAAKDDHSGHAGHQH